MARVKNRGQKYDKYWRRFNKLTDDFISGEYHKQELKELSIEVNKLEPNSDYEFKEQANLLYSIEIALEICNDNLEKEDGSIES